MKFEVKNRFTGYVQFTADIETNSESRSIQLDLAVKWGVDNGANLRGANLRDAYLRDAYLCYADLSGAYLRDANLSGAYLSGANLRDANLRGANLRGADLSDADLSGADLSGAYLCYADLCGANLRGANLSDANLSHNKTIISCCLGCYEMYLHQSNGAFMIKAGCRYFTIKAAKQHWSEANIESWTEKTKEYGERQLRMLEFLESEAKALGWKEEEK